MKINPYPVTVNNTALTTTGTNSHLMSEKWEAFIYKTCQLTPWSQGSLNTKPLTVEPEGFLLLKRQKKEGKYSQQYLMSV